jgi:hypothetical protein
MLEFINFFLLSQIKFLSEICPSVTVPCAHWIVAFEKSREKSFSSKITQKPFLKLLETPWSTQKLRMSSGPDLKSDKFNDFNDKLTKLCQSNSVWQANMWKRTCFSSSRSFWKLLLYTPDEHDMVKLDNFDDNLHISLLKKKLWTPLHCMKLFLKLTLIQLSKPKTDGQLLGFWHAISLQERPTASLIGAKRLFLSVPTLRPVNVTRKSTCEGQVRR